MKSVLLSENYLNDKQYFWVIWREIVTKYGFIKPEELRKMKKKDLIMIRDLG